MSKYMPGDAWLAGLPGESLVRQGLADYRAGRCTVAACLIDIGRPRLNSAGLIPPGMMAHLAEPESQLYRLLRAEGGDAYSRYNALLREFVSFECALDLRHRLSRDHAVGREMVAKQIFAQCEE